MSIIPKLTHKFNVIPNENPAGFFFFFLVEISKEMLKHIGKCKASRMAKAILRKDPERGTLLEPHCLIATFTIKLQ